MAEPVYKSVPGLDQYSGSLDGSETMVMVKAGKTYRRLLANLFGSGWITALLGAFDAFIAPNAIHADDADTVGGEDNAALHNAALLSGVANLANIPAELTGKNAATATKLATARTIGGVSFDGSANINLPGVNTPGNQDTSGNAATATTAASCSGNAATATTAASCSGNAATATTAASCSGYAQNTLNVGLLGKNEVAGVWAGGKIISAAHGIAINLTSGTITAVNTSSGYTVPANSIYIGAFCVCS